jgi:glycosyltransferase involved in cell wall biosynthesis
MISIVVPIYNEEAGLSLLYERLTRAAASWHEDYEVIAVDDGSHDGTLKILTTLASIDRRIKVLSFARNFGHQAAVTGGLMHAGGDAIAVIDADLQDPPEELDRFVRKLREGYDVVYAIRGKRKESAPKRLAYHVYYRVLRYLANIDIPLDAGDFCVISRRALDALNQLPERNRFVRGLRTWIGFRQVGLAYERHARAAGAPKYTLAKLMNLALDGVINFSYKPLRILGLVGMAVGVLAVVAAVAFFFQYVTNTTVLGYNPRHAPGWTSLMLAILSLSGLQLFGLGIIGEYIGRVFEETKGRPAYLIAATFNLPPGSTVDRGAPVGPATLERRF